MLLSVHFRKKLDLSVQTACMNKKLSSRDTNFCILHWRNDTTGFLQLDCRRILCIAQSEFPIRITAILLCKITLLTEEHTAHRADCKDHILHNHSLNISMHGSYDSFRTGLNQIRCADKAPWHLLSAVMFCIITVKLTFSCIDDVGIIHILAEPVL